MLIRAVCLLVVLAAGPASPWAASLCCDVSDQCCEGEQSSCPTLPDGECLAAASGQTPATVALDPPELPAPAAQARSRVALEAPALRALDADSIREHGPPRYLQHRALRI